MPLWVVAGCIWHFLAVVAVVVPLQWSASPLTAAPAASSSCSAAVAAPAACWFLFMPQHAPARTAPGFPSSHRLVAIGSVFCWVMIKWHFVRVRRSPESPALWPIRALLRNERIPCLGMVVAVNLTLNEVRNYKIKPRSMWGSFVLVVKNEIGSCFSPEPHSLTHFPPPLPSSSPLNKHNKDWAMSLLSLRIQHCLRAPVAGKIGFLWMPFNCSAGRWECHDWCWSDSLSDRGRWDPRQRDLYASLITRGSDGTTIGGNASLISRGIDTGSLYRCTGGKHRV